MQGEGSPRLEGVTNSITRVCVTGAGGFIASWIVKDLLEKGYVVRGTIRNPVNPNDPKNSHLRQFDGADSRRQLLKADLTYFDSIQSDVSRCDGVFHLASPDPVQMVDPSIQGTLNVLNAALQAGVRRAVMTSSIGAVAMDPHRDPIVVEEIAMDPNVVVDESCWSNLDYNWYCYGKAVAEQAAWNFAKEKNVDLVVLVPSLVLGPLLQPAMNASTFHLLKYTYAYVDVRDVAKACILLYETASASGRYLCDILAELYPQMHAFAHRGDVCDILAELYPQYPIPRK
ncbi:hypothetical protein KP509_05G070200 [Ceratopteris richardii]|uniref:NAD-dependent epimerase/dehydratase domain-containing protein n=1 Tax=Ceratopteris richardii TaxID=49495 RepID=A0A8T2UUY6_CERRI|nr:hypothetical protein KP509_05G070200 [Ceratopteris richardii]